MANKSFVFFDLDDTILDYSGNQLAAGLEACTPLAGRYDLDVRALHTTFRGTGDTLWRDPAVAAELRRDLVAASARLMTLAAASFGVVLSEREALEFSRSYRALRDVAVAVMPGAIELLTRLRSDGCRLGLITNGAASAQRHRLERFGLAPYFDLVVIEGEFGHGKPDERVFRHALSEFEAVAADALMVGDDLDADIAGAQRVGISTVWIDLAGVGLPDVAPAVPDRIIRRVADF